MTIKQENILKKLIETYFEGGNNRGVGGSGTLKSILDVIKDFVIENFS